MEGWKSRNWKFWKTPNVTERPSPGASNSHASAIVERGPGQAHGPEVGNTNADSSLSARNVDATDLQTSKISSAELEAVSITNTPAANREPSKKNRRQVTVPTTIRCTLTIGLETKFYNHDFEDLSWLDPAEYTRLEKARNEILRQVSTSKQVSFVSGDLWLFAREEGNEDGIEVDHRVFFIEEHWSRIPVMVAQYFGTHPYASVYLEVRWNYLRVERPTTDNTVMRKRLQDAMCTNWDGDSFLPRSQVDALFSREQVRALIVKDKDLCRELNLPEDKEGAFGEQIDQFVDRVFIDAPRLLAMCIWSEKSLTNLKIMLDHGLTDGDLPLSKKERGHDQPGPPDSKQWGLDQWVFDSIRGVQQPFSVHHFEQRTLGDHQRTLRENNFIIPDSKTIPILQGTQNDFLGKGSCGDVYRVTIHRLHHEFEMNRGQAFALKCFRKPRVEDEFSTERLALSALSQAPTKNLVIHLAFWEQRGRFYILFPLAERNLNDFLEDRGSFSLTKSSMLWILDQVHNLSEALGRIHILTLPGARPIASLDRLPPKQAQGRDFGYHHDLKPENILLFKAGDMEVWKISDFGNAKVYDPAKVAGDSSYRTPDLTMGNEAYGAPDWELQQAASRPYDIWSLGCIFLEILVWLLGWSGGGLTEFRANRKDECPRRSAAAFWYWGPEGSGNPVLRPTVSSVLEELGRRTQRHEFLQNLHLLVSKMLEIDPGDRPEAHLIVYNLEAIKVQAQLELTELEPEEPIHYENIPPQRSPSQLVVAPFPFGSERARRGSSESRSPPSPTSTHLHPVSSSDHRVTFAPRSRPSSSGGDKGSPLRHTESVDEILPQSGSQQRSPPVIVIPPEESGTQSRQFKPLSA